MASFRDMLPAAYRALLPAVFDEAAPDESGATCSDCAMCKGGETANHTFLPSTKCCTFSPQLPNYLVGALFLDGDPALDLGRERVREHIATRTRITPRWVAPSRRSQLLYDAARYEAFGRTRELGCRYYEDGRCSIWRYRESFCSTWFCKHDAGGDGRAMWRMVNAYLIDVERVLTARLAQLLAPELVEPDRHMTLEELEERPPTPESYSAWWGVWEGREEEFYRETAKLLTTLGPDDLLAILPQHHRRKLRLVETSHRATHDDTLPGELVLAPDARAEPIAGARVRVTGYSENDPLILSADAWAALDAFRTPAAPAAVLARVPALDRALLVRLTHWRVLVPGDGADDG